MSRTLTSKLEFILKKPTAEQLAFDTALAVALATTWGVAGDDDEGE